MNTRRMAIIEQPIDLDVQVSGVSDFFPMAG
jgi:hypothetical protein